MNSSTQIYGSSGTEELHNSRQILHNSRITQSGIPFLLEISEVW